MTTGVVLMTYGAPAGRDDLAAYLARVRGGKAPTDELVAEMARRYEVIGGSPLIARTVAQAEALERALVARGGAWRAAAGMRFSAPTIADAVSTHADAGATRLIGIVMSPQWSPTLMGGYVRALKEAASARGLRTVVAGAWHREPAFVASVALRVREALARVEDASRVAVVLTAHSLPRRVYDAEPDYIAQLRETGALVAEAAGLARWHWAYQSAGHTQEEWLRPDLVELFPSLATDGAREVLVVPVQFLADHLEVLYDLDVGAAAQAQAAGLRYRRIEMPNAHPSFIAALADIALRTARAEAVALV